MRADALDSCGTRAEGPGRGASTGAEQTHAGLVDAYADADPAAVKKPKLAVKKAEDRVAELAIKAEAADPLAARHIGSRPFRGRAPAS